jgi:hypothetical protein
VANLLPICTIWTVHYSAFWFWGLRIFLHIGFEVCIYMQKHMHNMQKNMQKNSALSIFCIFCIFLHIAMCKICKINELTCKNMQNYMHNMQNNIQKNNALFIFCKLEFAYCNM